MTVFSPNNGPGHLLHKHWHLYPAPSRVVYSLSSLVLRVAPGREAPYSRADDTENYGFFLAMSQRSSATFEGASVGITRIDIILGNNIHVIEIDILL